MSSIHPAPRRDWNPSFEVHLKNSRTRCGVVCPFPGLHPGFWIDRDGRLNSFGIEFACEGEVRSLFDLFAIPVAGWAASLPAEQGCGYIARYKYWKNGTGPHYLYAAIYVADYRHDPRANPRQRAILHCRPL
ncbi:MAG: hypothetical protein LBU95_06355 [Rikenellaceae bacterium]|jgi:hypothetical protein|nr:hypothetical protein [Rikenellaceae bacterium]